MRRLGGKVLTYRGASAEYDAAEQELMLELAGKLPRAEAAHVLALIHEGKAADDGARIREQTDEERELWASAR